MEFEDLDTDDAKVKLTAAGRDAIVALRVSRLAEKIPDDVAVVLPHGGPRRGLGSEITYQAQLARADVGGAVLRADSLKELRTKYGLDLISGVGKPVDQAHRLLSWSELEGILENTAIPVSN